MPAALWQPAELFVFYRCRRSLLAGGTKLYGCMGLFLLCSPVRFVGLHPVECLWLPAVHPQLWPAFRYQGGRNEKNGGLPRKESAVKDEKQSALTRSPMLGVVGHYLKAMEVGLYLGWARCSTQP